MSEELTIPPIQKPSPIQSAIAAMKKGGSSGITINPQESDAEVMLKMMDKILSNDNMEQKSRLIFENIRAMCQSVVFTKCMVDGTFFQHLPQVDGIQFVEPTELHDLEEFKNYPEFKEWDKQETLITDLRMLSEEMLKRIVSEGGVGRQDIIALAHAFSFQIQQHQHEQSLADKVIGLKR
jgi:hypothetical protein